MNKAVAIAGIIVLGCFCIQCSHLWSKEFVVEMTEDELQKKVDEAFPISKKYLIIFELTLTDPEVRLEEGSDRVGFGVSALTNVRVNEKDLTGQGHITARVQYKPKEGSLLLVDPQIENLDISLLPEKYEDEIVVAADISAKEFLDDYEIYRLNQSDFKQRLAKLVLRDVVVQNGVLRITLGLGE